MNYFFKQHTKPIKSQHLPYCRQPPHPPWHKQPCTNKLPVDVGLWILHLLLVFSAIFGDPTWQTYRYQ